MRLFFPLTIALAAVTAFAAEPVNLPTGLAVTPDAVPHSITMELNPNLRTRPNLTLGEAVTTAVSPDGKLLLVLTSGYNRLREERLHFNEYVLIFDITGGEPRQLQAVPVPNSFCGLAWNPNGQEFYVSGGVDDSMYVFAAAGGAFSRAAEVSLGHARGLGLFSNLAAPFNKTAPKPMVAGIAVNQSGTVAVVANFYNDSISLIDLKTRRKTAELDLRPGVSDRSKTGVAGGEYPWWIAIRGDARAYVSSPRDREIVAVNLTGSAPSVATRIPLRGQPNRLILNKAQDRLFVALDNADAVAVIDTTKDAVVGAIPVTAPEALLSADHRPRGANPNSLALSPDERTLYVSDGGTNAIAVVSLEAGGQGKVAGLIPTGWYPNSVSLSADGARFYVVNGKSVPGPNPGNCRGDVKAPKIPDCDRGPGNYVYELEKASLMTAPIPKGAELEALTRTVAKNNRFERLRADQNDPVMAQLRQKIKHVIYIVKENRTYDQVLGDLEVGNGDPSLAEFPEPVTPNFHGIARQFVTLDNFLDSGEVSGVGWNWTVGGRTTDFTEKTVPIEYAGRGFVYDWEGQNRNVNVGVGALPERLKAQPMLERPGSPADPNLMPGTGDVAAPDSAAGEIGSGYLWDEVLRAGLTVRNYGFFCDLTRYDDPKTNPAYLPISKTPFTDKKIQAVTVAKSLQDKTDVYFRSFDQNQADFYDFKEWEREFDGFVAGRNLPSLSLVRLAHDHFGSFGTALYKINTPAMEIADNDYAVGMLIEKLANSPYKDDTLVFVIEDDAQDGPDHVDAHRSVGLVAGPYVRQRAVVSERYTTVSMLRTIEAVLGLEPSSLTSAATAPMSEVFDPGQSPAWSFKAVVPDLLRTSELPLPAATASNSLPRTPAVLAWATDRHNAAYWQKRIGDMDYDEEDKLDTPRFNMELWKGMMPKRPYPVVRGGQDLRSGRAELLHKAGMDWYGQFGGTR